MIAFAVLALLLLAGALGAVLWPLLRVPAAKAAAGGAASNLDIHRDQYAELDRDLAAGTLDDAGYGEARAELERRVIEDAAAPAPAPAAARPSRAAAVAVGIVVPVAAALLYLYLGNPQGIDAPRHPAADLSSVTPEQFRDMTAKLAERMRGNPEDVQGWKMLGRAYRAMERYGEASDAYRHALALAPDDVELLGDCAESLALAAGRSMAGEPSRLLERARRIDPNNVRILALAGGAAFERKDYKGAVRDWEAALRQPGVDGELAQALRKGADEARARLAGKKPAPAARAGAERISGEVRLDASLKASVQPDDTVFVFARAADGPRMPLAVARIRARDLPYRFAFDDTSAMMPDMKLSGFGQVVVEARVSKSGSAAPEPGDPAGRSAAVEPGTKGIVVVIGRGAAP